MNQNLTVSQHQDYQEQQRNTPSASQIGLSISQLQDQGLRFVLDAMLTVLQNFNAVYSDYKRSFEQIIQELQQIKLDIGKQREITINEVEHKENRQLKEIKENLNKIQGTLTINKRGVEYRPKSYYKTLAEILGMEVKDVKSKIHSCLKPEDSQIDIALSKKIDEDKVNAHILHASAVAFNKNISIYNGRQRTGRWFGNKEHEKIYIYNVKNYFNIMKKNTKKMRENQQKINGQTIIEERPREVNMIGNYDGQQQQTLDTFIMKNK